MVYLPDSYIAQIPQIYRDVFAALPGIVPTRAKGDGLSVQTLHAELHEKYSLGEVHAACKELEKNGFAEIKHGVFLHPTEMGEELIAKLTGGKVPREIVPSLPPLPSPPVMEAKSN
jgi:hypothetical protein